MGYDNTKPIPQPKNTPKITREQYIWIIAQQEAIDFHIAAENAKARKRKPETRNAAAENPPAEEWRNDDAREVIAMFTTEEDFQYTDAARNGSIRYLRG